MASPPKRRSSRDKVRARRAQNLHPIQIWLPDTSSPGFAQLAHRESLAIAMSPYEKEDQDFIDAITDPDALYEN
jgi:ribosomal protein L32